MGGPSAAYATQKVISSKNAKNNLMCLAHGKHNIVLLSTPHILDTRVCAITNKARMLVNVLKNRARLHPIVFFDLLTCTIVYEAQSNLSTKVIWIGEKMREALP